MKEARWITLAVLMLILAGSSEAWAVTITWTGGAATNSWHTAGNWSLNRVPTAGDDVVIPDMTPNVNVTYSTGITTTINSLTSAEAFTLSGGTLTIDAASSLNSSFAFGSATLTGSGDVTVNGALNWTGTGTMSGTGKTIIAPSGAMSISGSNFKVLSRRLENHSPNATWTGGQFNFNNGILSNESDGTFTVNLTAGIFFSGAGTSAFTNAGIVNKIGAGGWFFGGMPFNNSGTVNLDAGTLDIQPSSGGTNTGTIDADAGTTVSFSATYTHAPASSLIGQGTLTFNGGTHTFTGTLSTNRIININGLAVNFDAPYTFTGTVNFAGGTLGGSGDVTMAGTMNWTGGGMMSGTGKTIIAPSGTLSIIGPTNFKTLSRRLENHSPNATWTGGGQVNLNNGTFSNESDGTFTVDLTAGHFFSGAGTSSFTNAGIVNKTGGGGWFIGGMPFNNSGTVNVDAGGLDLQSSSGGTNTGTIDADAGATLSFSVSYTHDPASSLIGQGMLTFNAGTHTFTGTLSTNRIININGTSVNFDAPYTFTGTVNFAGGTLGGSGDATIAGTMNWTGGGTMSGAGKTIIAPSGTLAIIGPTNFKTLSRRLENHSPNATWTGGGQVNFNNGIFSNESDGTFTVNLTAGHFFSGAGTNSFTNAGIVNKTGAGGWFFGGIPFNNSGTLNVDAGTLDLQSTSGGTNTGTIDVDAGATVSWSVSYTHDPASSLIGQGTLTFNSGTHTFTGTLSTNRIININGTSVNFDAPYTFTGTVNFAGGTLGGSGDATIAGTMNWTGGGTMSGAGKTIIAPSGTLAIIGPTNFKTLSRRLENHSPNATWNGGQFNLSNGTFSNESDGTFTVNLNGGHFFSGAGTSAFTNAGIVNKIGASTWFVSGMPFTNSGTLRVQTGILNMTSLTNFSGTTLTGGTYEVTGTLQFTAANIVTNAATIILDGPASAIQNTATANALANFATNNANATFQIKNGRNFALAGAFSNAGQVTIGAGDNTFSASALNNSGTISKPGAGVGSINSTVTQAGSGTIDVQAGTLTVTTLTNFSGTTLTGGIYKTAATLRLGSANIFNNAASIILDGPASVIENTVAVNALTNLVTNAATGALQVKNGRNLALAGDFNNSGQVTIGPAGGSVNLPGSYLQSAGVTQLDDGTLDPANTVDVQGGELKGNGSILAAVTNSGTCRPGLSPGSISITGDYTQTVAGTLEVEVGGPTAITQYDRLSVSGNAILLGTLRILLINGFAPAVADNFDIVTGEVSTKFSNIQMPVLPSLRGFQVEAVPTEQPTSLRLKVIDCGPGDADNDGVGDACDVPPELTSYTIAGGGRTFSSGGEFRVGSTIGQPAATSFSTPMTGGIFTLIGGFWAGTELVEAPACTLPGDMNLDATRNGKDIQVFANCVISGGGPGCDCADLNESATVTTADIAPFVQLLIN